MKLLAHEVEQKGIKTILKTQWRDHMKKAITIKIVKDVAAGFATTNTIETEDKAHMFGLLSGFAEIAWAWGWRPRGLVATVNHVVANYKEPAGPK